MTDAAAAATAAPADPSTTPAISDLLQPQPMTIEQAQAKRVEMIGNAGFRERILRGDHEAVAAWKNVHAALSPPVNSAEGQQYAKNWQSLSILRAKADLSDEVLDHAAGRGVVSLAERERALFAKERNFKDRAWVQRYLDGDRAANTEMALINLTLASRVGSFQEIEDFKAAAAKRLAANGRGK